MEKAFTIDDLKSALRDLPKPPPSLRPDLSGMMPFGGMPVFESPHATETYEETVTFPGHPIIKWLARWFNFDPDVHVTYVRHRPAAFIMQGRMFLHPLIAKDMRTGIIADLSVS